MSRSPLVWNCSSRCCEPARRSPRSARRSCSLRSGASSGLTSPSQRTSGGRPTFRWMSEAPRRTASPRIESSCMLIPYSAARSSNLIPYPAPRPRIASARSGTRARPRCLLGSGSSPSSIPRIEHPQELRPGDLPRGARPAVERLLELPRGAVERRELVARRPARTAASVEARPASSSMTAAAASRAGDEALVHPVARDRVDQARRRPRRRGPARRRSACPAAAAAAGARAAPRDRSGSSPCASQARLRCSRSFGPSLCQPPTPTFAWSPFGNTQA